MSHTTTRQGGVRGLRALGAVLLASGLGLLASQGAHAAAPPAGTSITNQATMSYKDSTGAQQLTTSNTVVTTVTQVGAYTLTPALGNTKSAAAGATVYMPYVLTNTGNGTDTFAITASEAAGQADFTKVEIYQDAGNGLPASTLALCTQTTAGSTCNVSKSLATGESFKFVIAYSIPSTATPGSWLTTAVPTGGNQGAVKVTPAAGTTWLNTYSQTASDKSESRTDTVNLTTGVAFSAGKSIAAPAVSAVSGSWPVNASGQRGTRTTYTLNYSNAGAIAGNLYIRDVLPAGFTYVTGQSVISCAGGTALTEGAGGDAALCGSLGVDFEQSGQTIQAVIPNVQPGSSGTLSFQVDVANTAPIGTSQTSNTAQYTAAGCSAGATIALCSTATVVNTNAADFTVLATRGVRLNLQDSTPGTPLSAADGVTSPTIVPGGFVRQTHTIQNTGNAPDTFNLTDDVSVATNWIFRWFQADGTTPLLDTDADLLSTVDTGVMQPGEVKTLVLQITAPNNATIGTGTAGIVEASSSSNATNSTTVIRDATFVRVTQVIGGYVDLTNSATGSVIAGDIGPGPGTQVVFTASPVVAGAWFSAIPIFVKNNDSVNTYTLEASGSNNFPGTLPAGWKVHFVPGTDCSVSAITTLAVAAGAQGSALACVASPVTAPTTTQPVYIKVTSTAPASSGATVSDIIYDAVSVVSVNAYRMELKAPSSVSAIRGGLVDLPHTLTNTGNNTCGAGTLQVTATFNDPNRLTAGWNTAIYLDADQNGVINAGDTLITDGILRTGGLAAGSSVKFLVRVYVPGGANIGDLSKVMVVVTDMLGTTPMTAPNGCGSGLVEDQVTVVSGTLTVLKKQSKSVGACNGSFPGTLSTDLTAANQTAAPGDCLYYEVEATNTGATPVNDVSITDAAPNYTTLQTTPISCSATGLTAGTVAASTTVNSITCGGTGTVLAPGGKLILRFATQINN